MRTLIFAETDAITGGDNITLDEFRNGLRIATPIAGAIVGLCFTHIFDRHLNNLPSRLGAMTLGAVIAHFVTEINIGDKAFLQHNNTML